MQVGVQDTGKELLRAARSMGPDLSALAWAMLAKGTFTCESWRKKKEERSVDETDRAGKTTKLYVPLSDECQTPLT